MRNENLILTDKEKKIINQHSTLKLQIEFVPATLWYENIRKFLVKSEWDKIRKAVCSESDIHPSFKTIRKLIENKFLTNPLEVIHHKSYIIN
jgi:hypothetical protein